MEQTKWFRLLKVLYVFSFIGILGTLIIFCLASKPTEEVDPYASIIQCENGNSYSAGDNGINLFNSQYELGGTEDYNARILCEYGKTDYQNPDYYDEMPTLNYTFTPAYVTPGYIDWALGSLAVLLITWLLFKIVRITFFYIMTGKRPRLSDLSGIL